jgi:hypothetical protein
MDKKMLNQNWEIVVLGIHAGERGSPESCNVELGNAYSALPRRVTLIEKTHEKSAAILLSDAAPVNRIHGVVEPTTSY